MDDHPQFKAVIEKVLHGEVDAYGLLVEHYNVRLRAFIAARVGDYHAAEDLAQEAFLVAFRKLERFDREQSFGSWLHGIAGNLARNYIKKRRELLVESDEALQHIFESHVKFMEEHCGGGGPIIALRNCLDRIKPDVRELLEKRYVQGYSVRELSELTRQNYSTLTMIFHRLRLSLKDCIEKKMGPLEGVRHA